MLLAGCGVSVDQSGFLQFKDLVHALLRQRQHGIEPVSYTHLDVYKRQLMYTSLYGTSKNYLRCHHCVKNKLTVED